jgi:23S rRNA (cytidine1920-2'-O)/16S rRNA (cytidine1409-2'-O)-methyltransferase
VEGLTVADVEVSSSSQTLRYVSRGGLKLEGALKHLDLEVEGRRILDVGLSTGGFSDCLLQAGAAAVAGVDVGHGQLHPRLQGDIRLTAWEGVNVRDLENHHPLSAWLKSGVDLAVVDVSFISLEHVWPVLGRLMPPGARVLALVKPQFEVGAAHLNRRGVVDADPALFDDVKGRVLHALVRYGFSVQDYFPCVVKGQDGNQEFFAYAQRVVDGLSDGLSDPATPKKPARGSGDTGVE